MKALERKEVDMHIHSDYSDSDPTIKKLVQRIKKTGLKAAVLTDHEKIDGTEEFMNLCAKNKIDTTTGIEMSTSYLDYAHEIFLELHILGYGFDLKEIKRRDNGLCLSFNSKQRNLDVLEAIEETRNRYCNITSTVTEKDIADLFKLPQPLISRYWVAKYIAHHLVRMIDDHSFDELVRDIWQEIKHSSNHEIPRRFANPQEVIELITMSGGIAVWAHPNLTLKKLRNKYEEKQAMRIFHSITKRLKDYGIFGMEVFTAHNKGPEIALMKNVCKKYHLSPDFGGSDYHGDDENEHKPELYLGRGGISYEQFLNMRS